MKNNEQFSIEGSDLQERSLSFLENQPSKTSIPSALAGQVARKILWYPLKVEIPDKKLLQVATFQEADVLSLVPLTPTLNY